MASSKFKGVQVFDLTDRKQEKAYYAMLKNVVKNKQKIPIMAKGMMRLVDFTKKLAKLDIYPPFETAWTKKEKIILGKFFCGQ
ncbi:MAG: hypothetical protein QW625_01305 [Candidatus Nanoarchaeia archaeon]